MPLRLVLTVAVLFCSWVPSVVFAVEMGSWGFVPGGPRGTGVAKFDVTIVVNGQKVTRPVTIPNGAIKAWTRPGRLPTDSDEDYAQKLADALGTASQAKAMVIAAAINTAFKAEFQQLGVQATSAIKQIETVQNVGQIFIKVPSATFGEVIIPSVSKEQGNPIKVLENKILGESGNGGRFLPMGKPSPGAKSSLERATPGIATVSTGVDPDGQPSYVEIGVDGVVARLIVGIGLTDEDVLEALEVQLDQIGLPATFDEATETLFLDSPVQDDHTFVWGNTDTGLEFLASMEGLAVPSPWGSSVMLVLVGVFVFLLMAQAGRRRRSVPAEGSSTARHT